MNRLMAEFLKTMDVADEQIVFLNLVKCTR